MRARANAVVSTIEASILLLRGQKVLPDSALAKLNGVEIRAPAQAVQRNRSRFLADFMFQLDQQEFANLQSQFVTASWGGHRNLPHAFTGQGVAMLDGDPTWTIATKTKNPAAAGSDIRDRRGHCVALRQCPCKP